MKAIKTVALIAIIRYLFIAINLYINLVQPYDGWVNYFYLPAGVNVIATLVCGHLGALGVGVGSFVWNIFNKNMDLVSAITLSIVPVLSCSASWFVYQKLTHQTLPTEWRTPSLQDIVRFVVIYAIINSALHHLVFPYVLGGRMFSQSSLFQMLIGDFLGATFLFVCLNILASLLIDLMKYLTSENEV